MAQILENLKFILKLCDKNPVVDRSWWDAHPRALEHYECSTCFSVLYAEALRVGISALYMVKLEAES